MKVLAVVLALCALSLAAPEAPRYRAPPAPVREYGAPEQAHEAPYAPSGWRPSGRQFLLPVRQQDAYYGPPPQEYGPPATEAPTTTEEPTTTDTPTTENPDEDDNSAELAEGGSGARANQADRDGAPAGVYYVLLPDGRLQRVAYSTNPALPPPAAAPLKNSGFAQLQYMDVEPIRAPIYSYGAPFIRVF